MRLRKAVSGECPTCIRGWGWHGLLNLPRTNACLKKFSPGRGCTFVKVKQTNKQTNKKTRADFYCLTRLKKQKSFLVAQMVKVSPYNAGDPGSIPGLGRSPGEGNGNPLQYSCLKNPMNGRAW